MNSKRIAAERSRVYIIVTTIAALLGTVSATGLMREYTAAEAKRHIGENATVVGRIDCIGQGRRHVDLQIGGCLPNTLVWIVLPNEAGGPEVDPETLRGVTIAVTGKIESSSGTPQITVKSTTDIQARSALQTNYVGALTTKNNMVISRGLWKIWSKRLSTSQPDATKHVSIWREIDFVAKTSRARGKAKQYLVKTIVKQAPNDWKAAAWILSHCWPNEFTEIVRNEVAMMGGIVLLPPKSPGQE